MRKDKRKARARTAAQERSGEEPNEPAAAGKERGSATVLATGVTAALLAAAVAFTALGQASAARHRAQGAADAGALAGAARVLFGEGDACAAAQAMVERSEAEFRACEVSGLEVTVHVNETPNGLPGAFGPARAVSRAGPVAVE
ncbi:Rv3654c family TadE-like protein [Glycomyces niveus]|uniref:Flp pilus-assembly TadE/G-like family protein n=1 Tax=Glycomyces niveus TaxID=2820287 RepID=A0ABS3U5Z2_9ACTN|nr:Rv3654c family TadE-like protein [Glycomyces sp. NEAU-S30]MBO3734181.1 flp pilus-assembly TadE/G-like family protein [Glycomyces sp. NEAU-S30]